jgi:tetratricopeptide (TPR) repeat protein
LNRAVSLLLLAALPAGPAILAADAPDAAPHAYLIMPFENTAEDRSLDWLSTGLAHTLGEYLLGFGQQVMDDEERSVLLEGSGIPAGAPLALASALELGRRTLARSGGMRIDRLILGRFNVENGEIMLAARTIDVRQEKARPWLSRSGRLTDLQEVHRDLALALAKDENIQVSGGRSELLRKQSEDAPLLAFDTYSRAMAESDTKRRLQLLRKAMQQFPGYPKAAYQAGSLLAREERWEEAAAVLGQATSDPFPYESDFHLLSALVALKRKDPRGAMAEARRALAIADTARGHLLLGKALQASGDRAAALVELEKAQSADPSDADIEDLRRALNEGTTERRSP